ncbi:hypothetical protein [Aetokthonos hydrillicola]|uniref:hypothetical protein n=1 Tax=Aetokthonos hydrillicola TaxID=1550245 RepID=UPI001B15EBEB
MFEASPDNAQEITTLLKADTGRLWNRVEAALKVKPNRSEVKAWGALILAAKFGQERANSWIKNQEGALSREQGSRGVDIYGR